MNESRVVKNDEEASGTLIEPVWEDGATTFPDYRAHRRQRAPSTALACRESHDAMLMLMRSPTYGTMSGVLPGTGVDVLGVLYRTTCVVCAVLLGLLVGWMMRPHGL
jgi:hypothetical protein